MRGYLKSITISFALALLLSGSALADSFNLRPVYTGGSTLDTLQSVFTGIGSTIDVRTDQSGAAIFTNQTSGSNAAYVASLSWDAENTPFIFGIYESGNPDNKVPIFVDNTNGTGQSNPGDWTTINFDFIGGMIYSEYHDAGTMGSTVVGSTSDWMNAFGFYFSYDTLGGVATFYSQDSLNQVGASALTFLGKGDAVNIAGLPGNDANHWYVAMEGWGTAGAAPDFTDIVVQMESVVPVSAPEPGTLLLFGTGLGALGIIRYRRKR